MSFSRFASLTCLLSLYFLVSSVNPQPICNDCCNQTGYTELNEPRRSRKSVWQRGQTPLCDRRLRRGWYRFTSFGGTKMPETAVKDSRCGTHDPVWLSDPHPTTAQGILTAKACITSFGDTCSDHLYINIKKCGDYYVYYLKPLYYCASAYCAGFGDPCPYGKVGEPPNCNAPFEKFSSDNLGDPVISYAPGEDVAVTLTCEVPLLNLVGTWNNVTYRIEWYAEGKTLLTYERCNVGNCNGKKNNAPCPNANSIQSKLKGTLYKIGQSLSCNVSAKFTNVACKPDAWSTPKHVREPFFAGLKVSPTVLNLEACNKEHYNIIITPTIPVRPDNSGYNKGLPEIAFYAPPEVEILSSCEVQLPKGINPVTLKIKAACPGTKGLKRIIPVISKKNSNFWDFGPRLPTIWINIIKKGEIHQCLSCGDPHYHPLQPLTFGQYYDYMGRGDFVLYRNTERHFEVHTRQWTCGSSVTCNCGVALRDHNDVIEFNCCNDIMERDQKTPIFVKIRSKKCLAQGISIKKVTPGVNDAQYEVMFPSGAKVAITRTYWGMDISLYTPRAKNSTNEKGLCLKPDNRDPAYLEDYGNSSRLLQGESYFDTLPPEVDDYNVTYTQACHCKEAKNNGTAVCEDTYVTRFPNLVNKNWSPMFLCDRKKRNVHFSDDPTEEDMKLFKQTRSSHHRRSRREVQNEISKENATRYCAERLSETKIGKLCARVGVNVDVLVHVCAADIQVNNK